LLATWLLPPLFLGSSPWFLSLVPLLWLLSRESNEAKVSRFRATAHHDEGEDKDDRDFDEEEMLGKQRSKVPSAKSKQVSWILLCLIGCIVFSLWYMLLEGESTRMQPNQLDEDEMEVYEKRYPRGPAPKDKLDEYFTVVMITYRRMDLFRTTIEMYCNIPEVDQVLLIWNNIDLNEFPLPDPDSFNCEAPVVVCCHPPLLLSRCNGSRVKREADETQSQTPNSKID